MLCNSCSTKKICKVVDAINNSNIIISSCEFYNQHNSIQNKTKQEDKNLLDITDRLKKPDLKKIDKNFENKEKPNIINCPSCNGVCYDTSLGVCNDCGKPICDNCSNNIVINNKVMHYCNDCYKKH